MNAALLFVLAIAPGAATDGAHFDRSGTPFEQALRGIADELVVRPLVIRGQAPFEELPPPGGNPTFAPGAAPPGTFGPGPPPFQPGPPIYQPQQPPGTYDPFLPQPGIQAPTNPYGGGPPPAFGANGPQPYRFGWTHRLDYTTMPSASATKGLGDIGIEALDAEWEYTTPHGPWIFSFTQELDIRWLDGPRSSRTGPPLLRGAGFPEQLYRIGWDFELATPANGPWSFQLGFNPSINSSFERGLTRDAWNFDGRAILFYQQSPQWMWALGAGFWDRVDNMVIPYAGVIFTPDDRWEYRLVFPEPRISYFLGNTFSRTGTWAYVRGEYHVEAYEVELDYPVPFGFERQEKMQMSDWRVLLGLRAETGSVTSFIEAGWVFEREVEFLHGTPGFDIGSGFIGRVGIRY